MMSTFDVWIGKLCTIIDVYERNTSNWTWKTHTRPSKVEILLTSCSKQQNCAHLSFDSGKHYFIINKFGEVWKCGYTQISSRCIQIRYRSISIWLVINLKLHDQILDFKNHLCGCVIGGYAAQGVSNANEIMIISNSVTMPNNKSCTTQSIKFKSQRNQIYTHIVQINRIGALIGGHMTCDGATKKKTHRHTHTPFYWIYAAQKSSEPL